MKSATNLLNQAVERMSTGYKVNHAKDNAAAYSIITNMDTKIGAYQVAEDNCAMGLDMLTTATESLDLIYDKLTRLRDLAEQASNGTYGEQSKKAINSEANALQKEIERLYNTAEYNGKKLLKSEAKTLEETLSEKYGANNGFVNKVTERDTTTMTSLQEEWDNEGYIQTGTYSVSSIEELKLLNDISDAFDSGIELVLTEDLDLTGLTNFSVEPYAAGALITIDGNGHVIKNLSGAIGLFGGDITFKIKNLGLKNIDINSSARDIGAFVNHSTGFVTIENCFVTGSIRGYDNVGGFVGFANLGVNIKDSYSSCLVAGTGNLGAVVGATNEDTVTVDNVSIYSSELGAVGLVNFYPGLDLSIFDTLVDYEKVSIADNLYSLQVGIASNSTSQIGFDLSISNFDLSELLALRVDSKDALTKLDEYILKVTSKQVELGSVSNRLDSALNEISTQYENLVSSRSTLRDADIAEVSSEYIQQQILQQASATLMATANQAPAIALQLI